MVNHDRPIADSTLRIGNWYVEQMKAKREVWLTDPNGKVFIIRLTTYDITHVPRYVYRKIDKSGFLNEWKIAQAFNAITRLTQAVTAYHKFTTKTQDTPLVPHYDSITPLTLPF